MTTINLEEKTILEALDHIINDPNIKDSLAPFIEEAKQTKEDFASITVPISLFKDMLPKEINLCRIFVLRAKKASRVEKHTNSFQRTLTIIGSGNTKILNNNTWTSNLRKDSDKVIENRWLSIPADTWHQPLAEEEDWITITFHTADADEIIDEYKGDKYEQ